MLDDNDEDDNSNNNKKTSSTTNTTTELLLATGKKQEQLRQQQEQNKQDDYSHTGENCHSKYTEEKDEEQLEIEYLKPELKAKIKEEFGKSNREQKRLLKENKQNIIDFLLDNKDAIRVEDFKIYEPIYKCYREKGIVLFVTSCLILLVQIVVIIIKRFGYVLIIGNNMK